MKLSAFRTVLTAVFLLIAGSALANDGAIATKLVGNWQGEWQFSGKAGKLTSKISAAEGTKLKGQATWFGTAYGDLDLNFDSAEVKDGAVSVEHPYGMSFKATVAADGKSMKGTWSSSAGNGPMELKKVD